MSIWGSKRMTKFFVLSRDYSQSIYAFLENGEAGDSLRPPVCPKCGEELAPSSDGPNAVYTIKRSLLGDMISDGISVGVTRRFADAYHSSDLVGFEIAEWPLRLRDSSRDYFLAIPAATCTLVDEMEAGVVVHELRGCDFCRVMSIDKIERLVIDETTWHGEDVFCCGNLFSEIIVTQEFVDFVALNQFTNFHFVQSDRFHFDYRRK